MSESPIKLIKTQRFSDARGWFTETFHRARWAGLGVDCDFVQDNQSFSADIGTIRGIHFQIPPHAQAKLIRCTRGAIIDYIVDLRRGSPSYGEHVRIELSAASGDQIFIPIGFGHGFITIEPDSEVMYKVSDYYAPGSERGIRWDCPILGIVWPLPAGGPIMTDKDALLPGLPEFYSPFVYDGVPMGTL